MKRHQEEEEERLKLAELRREEEKQRELQQRKLDDSQFSKDPETPTSGKQNLTEDVGRSLQSNTGQPLANLLPEKGRENERKCRDI